MSAEPPSAAAQATRISSAVLLAALPFLLGAVTSPRTPRAPVGQFDDSAIPGSMIAEVSDSKALGYVSNRKFLIDSKGTVYCAVRAGRSGRTGVCLLHSATPWPEAKRFESACLEDRPGIDVSTAPQRSASIALGGDGTVHMVWYGGSAAAPAHQIRYARFSPTLQIVEETELCKVTGFEAVYPDVLTGDELWQEHPCLAASSDGQLYAVWEARDSLRIRSPGTPQPGIAWAVRGPDGLWSVSGPVTAPRYLQVDASFPSQSRPTLVAGAGGEMHVICYGSVGGLQQILHGVLRRGNFSGWSVVAPSPGDQRHVSACSDTSGRVHLVWREGPAGPGSAETIGVFYASLDGSGRVTGPVRVSPAAEDASTPSVVASGGTVWVAWVAWNPGGLNSEGKRDNGYPADNATVEGRLEVRGWRSGSPSFDPVMRGDAGPASYPTWALRSDSSRAEALIWTHNRPGGNGSLMLAPVGAP